MFLIYYIFLKYLIQIYFYISRVESETQVQTRQPWRGGMTTSNPRYHLNTALYVRHQTEQIEKVSAKLWILSYHLWSLPKFSNVML